MYLAALICNSSKSNASFLHRLLKKDPSRNVVIKWCIATAASRFQIFNATFQKCFMKVHNGSFFSCRMLTRATDVRWCVGLVTNCDLKRVAKVSNESTELGGSHINHLWVSLFIDVGNTWQRIVSFVVYKLTWVM